MPKTIPVSKEVRANILAAKNENPSLSVRELSKLYGPHRKTVSRILRQAGVSVDSPKKSLDTVEQRLDKIREERDVRRENLIEERKFLLDKNEILERQIKAALDIKNSDSSCYKIEPKYNKGESESAAVVLWSDWHNEELVDPSKVNGLNNFNLEIFHNRATRLFQGTQRLWYLLNKDTKISTMVVGLLGDFISGNLHGDQQESNQLGPTMAIENASKEIITGLKFLLEHTDIKEFVVVCKSGNHGRFTIKQRHNTESENSLEYLMYCNLSRLFENEPRVKFVVEKGYLSHVVLFDNYTIRFHHGHDIKYAGGVGGIYIPTLKKIGAWNRSCIPGIPPVALDCFGHFHQYIDADNFVANGSLIGYNPYSIAIGAPFQAPQQAMFLVNKRFKAKTIATPVFMEG